VRALLLAIAILVLATPPAASADPTVDPDRRNTSVLLKADRVIRPSMREAGPPGRARKSKNSVEESYTSIYSICRVDPAANIYGCRVATPAGPGDPQAPELTEGDIVEAVREIGLPALAVRIQPDDETLVNIETIFYTRPLPFERGVTLLGFDVDLVATPVSYRWVHDDGTASTTSRPGKPYPAMDVTHRYREPATDVHPRVDVSYRVRYRVDGGAWRTIGQTLVASGPAAELDVREAAPVLTRP
jgi:hypothetical protein